MMTVCITTTSSLFHYLYPQIPFESTWDYEAMVLGTRVFLDAITEHVPSVQSGAFQHASVLGEYIYTHRYKRLMERGDVRQSVDKVSVIRSH